MKHNKILQMILAIVMSVSFFGCQKIADTVEQNTTQSVSIMLDVDNVNLESANIRVRHNGGADVLWTYICTSDLESPAAQLLQEKVSAEVDLTEQIVAFTGTNKSVTTSGLEPKSYYRFICSVIDPVNGIDTKSVAELKFRTRRDPSVYVLNDNWSIQTGDRVINHADQMEYDNFLCKSADDETYVMLSLKASEFNNEYGNDIRSLFEDYVADYGIPEGDSKWKNIVKSGDTNWSEQRLRSGDWIIFMVGVDKEGELTGLYQQLAFTIEEETASDEYNRWLGTWTVSDKDGVELFNIDILPNENNLWYYMAGWESSNIYSFDTYDSHMMPELYFEKSTGKLCFISQFVVEMIDGTDKLHFYFSGTFTYGNTYLLGNEVLNYKMAESSFLDTDSYSKARVDGCKFVTQGMEFPIESIAYFYYRGSNPSPINLTPPSLPLMLTKVTE